MASSTVLLNTTPPSRQVIQENNMDLEMRFVLYTVCGSVVLVNSLLTIIVFSLTKEFRTKYALFNGLAVADFINGLSFVIAGIYRSKYLRNGTYFLPITNSECIYGTPWAVLMIVAGQLPAFLNLCISFERAVALEFSTWYRRIWREHYKHYLVLGCILLTLLSLGFVLVLDRFHTRINPDRICAVMNSTGILYGTIHYTVCALIFLACFFTLYSIFRKTNRSRTPSKKERKRQLFLISITGVSVVLVSIPNLVLILSEWKLPEMNPLVVGIAYSLYALHSSLSLPIYLYFRHDFRRRFMWLFFRTDIGREDGSNAPVTPITPTISITGPKGNIIFVKRQKDSL